MVKDELFQNRQVLLDNTVKLVNSANAMPVSIALNSDLGFGKTFFLDHLKANLENNNYPVFKFNSWEYDLESDAFIAIINCLIPQLLKFGGSSQNIDDWRSSIVGAIGSIACATITAFIPQPVKEVATTALEVKKTVDNHNDNPFVYNFPKMSLEEAKQKFKKCLEVYRGSLVDKYKDKPIVFIIDELDRCRPDFAIKVLECVKHLFDVKGYCFIFGVCLSQLDKSIQHVFGNIDVDIYLRRFFDYKLNLPTPNNKEYWNCLFLGNKPSNKCFIYLSNLIKDSEGLISLRDIDQLARNYELIGKIQELGDNLFSMFVAIILFGNFVAPNFIVNYFTNGNYEFKESEKKIEKIFNNIVVGDDYGKFDSFLYFDRSIHNSKKYYFYYKDADDCAIGFPKYGIDESKKFYEWNSAQAAYKLINSLITV